MGRGNVSLRQRVHREHQDFSFETTYTLTMQRCLVLCVSLLALVSADDCPDGGVCGEGNTCCKAPSNVYECCPLHQAECCEDHVHCCPMGTLCQVNTSTCVNSTVSLPWAERVSVKQSKYSKSFRMISTYAVAEDDNLCPDNSHCPAEFSCLQTIKGYGCCPVAHAVNCSDGKHCCREGHQCSKDGSVCMKQEEPVVSVMCSDRESECPEGTTCCESADGSWGCCPMPKAVCCEDNIHCCPESSTCDIKQSKCLSAANKEMPMWAKFPARIRAEWENPKIVTTPIPDTTTSASTSPAPLRKGATSLSPSVQADDVPCDNTTSCEDGKTCCKTKEGGWACCPLPQAVCCDDFIHCCPHGKVCNVPAGTCDDPSGKPSTPWLEKVPAVSQKVERSGNVTCDSTHACPDGNTCCKTEKGDWTCCSFPEAVCCEDHIHCCPKDTICNLPAQTCDSPYGKPSEPWLEKFPAVPRKVKIPGDVACNTTYSCPDGNTCCKTETGDWACCPLPEAVCCEDHQTCCPHGTICDVAAQKCNSPTGPVPMVTKVPALKTLAQDFKEPPTEDMGALTNNVPRIQCDTHTTCPKDTTCCLIKSTHKWGCCPLPEAECCDEGDHCCPKGYKCDVGALSCYKGEVVIPWYNKLAAKTEEDAQAAPASVKCDAQNRCPEGSSCCQRSTGQWGCCPLQKAVCCADEEHCCPEDYSCNMGTGTCQKLISLQYHMVPLTRVSAAELLTQKHKDVQCGGSFVCKEGETCCKVSSTTWGCCPSPNAVCCNDMKHCCPAGYICGEGGSCTQSTGFNWAHWQVFFSNKKRALRV
ncbi:hypothetical protein UPYG_G00106180 [Umbra pygmaea]|uniref:Granulins domain-containing protein n=1 Tax=Umbra pygmaea TaxID=75934 RepID=A0ABD0X1Y0_UMBPY